MDTVHRVFRVAFLLVAVLLLGCGSSNSTDDGAAADDLGISGADLEMLGTDLSFDANDDSGQLSDQGAPADLNGVCNTLSDDAPIVQQVVVNQPMPSPTSGGSIASGIYYLTDSKIYQGSPMSPLQLRMTQNISGTTVQTVLNFGTAPNTGNHDTRTYTTSGTSLMVTFTCGGSGTATLGIDATATQYITYNNASKVVNTFTKQ